MQINPIAYDGNINILESSSIREEVNEVARQIIKDTRDKQYRYQDIAILYRDEAYAYLFDSVLPQYDIPFNIDTKKINDTSSDHGNGTLTFGSYSNKLEY